MDRRHMCAVAIAGLLVPATAGVAFADDPPPSITPAEVEELILPGGSYEVEKTVQTAAIPPKIQVCLLEDETGSFSDDIGNLQAAAGAIFDDVDAATSMAEFAVAGFRDYDVDGYGSPGDWVYRLLSPMSDLKADWTAGVGGLTAGGGGDGPEAQYDAIVAALNGGYGEDPCGFGTDADVARVLLVATDAPFHTPDGTHQNSEADVLAALATADVTVIGLKGPGAGSELDALAAGTDGSVQAVSSDGSNIAAAILAGLSNLEVEVAMTSDCVYPITTDFAPESQTVTSGETAVFTETISVASDAPGGIYECKDWALVNGEPLVDADENIIYETKSTLVPENFVTGGGNVTEGKGKDRTNHLSFGGNAGYMADGTILGQWSFNFHEDGVKVHTTSIDRLQFFDTGLEPAPPESDADSALMYGTARVNFGDGWVEDCDFVAGFQDGGEPEEDGVGIAVSCAGDLTYEVDYLSGGNIQLHDGTKD